MTETVQFIETSNYVRFESTPEQDLQSEMNGVDRLFVSRLINECEWYWKQMESIRKYKEIILKI